MKTLQEKLTKLQAEIRAEEATKAKEELGLPVRGIRGVREAVLPSEEYIGLRTSARATADVGEVFKFLGNTGMKLPLRLDLYNHSPTGFDWGYGGSGPSQLALAILADATGDDQYALARRQDFKSEVISGLAYDNWRLTQVSVREWVDAHPG